MVLNLKRIKTLCGAVFFGGMMALSAPVAANEAMLDLLKIMRDNGQITAEQYELLVNAARADAEKVEGAKQEAAKIAKEEVEKEAKKLPKVTTDGKFKVESQDGDWSFQPIGRIFWDTVWVDEDDGALADGGLEESGTELRRARLGFEAKFMHVFKSKLELDFAESGEPEWKDVWISYNNENQLGDWWLKLGQQHVSQGHATISSSKYMPLMRRPLFADGPQLARKVGIAFRQESAEKNRWFFHTGFYLQGLDPESDEVNTDTGGEESNFFSVRLGGTPFYRDDKHMLHLGGSYLYTDPNGDTFNNIDNALVTHLGDGDAIEADFGENTEDANTFGGEVIGIWGPFHGVFEYIHWDVSDPDGDADMDAWALDAGWFITGESMKYKYGEFSGIKPNNAFGKGGWGAWQIAARIENMDLNDGLDIDGGEATVFTVGLNWYPVSNVRFMANYGTVLDFDCQDTTTIDFDGCNNTLGDDIEPSAFSMRAQVYW